MVGVVCGRDPCSSGGQVIASGFISSVGSASGTPGFPGVKSGQVLITDAGSRWRAKRGLSIHNGDVTVQDGGELVVAEDGGAATLFIGTHGRLFGNARVIAHQGVYNAGTVGVLSNATLTIAGGYAQDAAGTLEIDIFDSPVPGIPPGPPYEKLHIEDANASLNGTLKIVYGTSSLPLYSPVTLVELTGTSPGTLSGVFASVDVDDFFNLLAPDEALAVTYNATQVLAQRALAGDANLSQQVEQGDLDAVLQNWGKTAAVHGISWATGDLNGNGQVEQGDLDRVLQNWGNILNAPDFTGFSVPEPATLVNLGGLAVLAGLRRRPAA